MKEFAQSERLILRKVTPADLEAVEEYRREFLEQGGTMDGCSNLRRYSRKRSGGPEKRRSFAVVLDLLMLILNS